MVLRLRVKNTRKVITKKTYNFFIGLLRIIGLKLIRLKICHELFFVSATTAAPFSVKYYYFVRMNTNGCKTPSVTLRKYRLYCSEHKCFFESSFKSKFLLCIHLLFDTLNFFVIE